MARKVGGISVGDALIWITQSVKLSASTTCASVVPVATALTKVDRALFGYRLCMMPLTLFLHSSSEAKFQYCVSG
jgi:hypothetical protein